MIKGYITKLNNSEIYINIEMWGYGNMTIIEALEAEGVNLDNDIKAMKPGETKYYKF